MCLNLAGQPLHKSRYRGSGRGQPCHAIILLSHDIMFWDHVTGVCESNALNAWPLVKETSLDSGACILKATVSVEFNISVSVIYIYISYVYRTDQ